MKQNNRLSSFELKKKKILKVLKETDYYESYQEKIFDAKSIKEIKELLSFLHPIILGRMGLFKSENNDGYSVSSSPKTISVNKRN